MGKPGTGDVAPGFTLPGTGGQTYSLSGFRGQPVVLVFYPGDNTPVCTTQLNQYSADIDSFEGLDAVVLAVSPQSVESHEQFSCKQGGFKFPLLADESKSVGEQYGVVGPLGFYRRSVFVIDAAGVIRYAHRSAHGLTFKKSDELVRAIKDAAAAA
jgi:peroxiredoxin Q/BCP